MQLSRDTSTVLGAITATTKLMIAFHVMSAYPILMNVVLVEVEETLNIRPKSQNTGSEMEGSSDGSGCDCKRTIARILLRLSAVGLTCFVAIMVPFSQTSW